MRQWVYRTFWVVGVLLGATQAGYAVAEAASPAWVKIALGVLAYVSVATNYTADRNVAQASPAATYDAKHDQP